MSVSTTATGVPLSPISSICANPASCLVTFEFRTPEECPAHSAPEDARWLPEFIFTITKPDTSESKEPSQERDEVKTDALPGQDGMSLSTCLWRVSVAPALLSGQLQHSLWEATGLCEHCTAERREDMRTVLESPEEFSKFLNTLGDWEGPDSVPSRQSSVGTKVWRVMTTPAHLLARAMHWSLERTGLCESCTPERRDIITEIYSRPENMLAVFKQAGIELRSVMTGSPAVTSAHCAEEDKAEADLNGDKEL